MAWPTTSRHERGYGTAWEKLRKTILARDKHLCQTCRAEGRLKVGNIVDHRIAKAKGGTDDPDNLAVICADHHKAKTAEESGRPLRQKPRISVDGWPEEG